MCVNYFLVGNDRRKIKYKKYMYIYMKGLIIFVLKVMKEVLKTEVRP